MFLGAFSSSVGPVVAYTVRVLRGSSLTNRGVFRRESEESTCLNVTYTSFLAGQDVVCMSRSTEIMCRSPEITGSPPFLSP